MYTLLFLALIFLSFLFSLATYQERKFNDKPYWKRFVAGMIVVASITVGVSILIGISYLLMWILINIIYGLFWIGTHMP